VSHEVLVALPAILAGVGALLVLAGRTRVPYPILLVVGGAALALVPGVPEVALEPDLVLVLFLPPLLYAAAFFTSLPELRRTARPIGMLAVGAVGATVLGVAAAGHWLLGLPWEAAFVLGAVLGPTDPVAATAIAGRLGAPRRYVSIVEGESLVNDATALIAYKVAVAAAVTGAFSLGDAALDLVVAALGGVAIGAAVGWAVTEVRRRIDDAPTEIAVSFLAPYLAYLPAEALGVSAVLAAVVTGVWLGWRAREIVAPSTRIQAFATWEVLVFVLNAAIFVLVGLQLPVVADGVAVGPLLLDAALVVAVLTAVRFAWVLVTGSGPRGRHEPPRDRRVQVLVAFTGLRGAVSLAAALAIPAEVPARDELVFLAYAAVFATVVGQGLALPWVIARLGLRGSDEERERVELRARRDAAQAALDRLEELDGSDWVADDTLRRMRELYAFRVRRFDQRLEGRDDELERRSAAYQRLRREVLEAERRAIVRLHDDGGLDDELMRRVERDIDLDDARLG
jgi:monovalent cation/hydrogen antiporter